MEQLAFFMHDLKMINNNDNENKVFVRLPVILSLSVANTEFS